MSCSTSTNHSDALFQILNPRGQLFARHAPQFGNVTVLHADVGLNGHRLQKANVRTRAPEASYRVA